MGPFWPPPIREQPKKKRSILKKVKIYINNTHITTKKCVIIKIYISKDYIVIKNRIPEFFKHFIRNKSTKTNLNAERQAPTAFPHISWVLYLSTQCFSIKFSLETTFILHCLSLILIKNNVKYNKYKQLYHIYLSQQLVLQKDKYQQLYHKFFEFYSHQGQIIMYENDYQQLYHTFFFLLAVRKNP